MYVSTLLHFLLHEHPISAFLGALLIFSTVNHWKPWRSTASFLCLHLVPSCGDVVSTELDSYLYLWLHFWTLAAWDKIDPSSGSPWHATLSELTSLAFIKLSVSWTTPESRRRMEAYYALSSYYTVDWKKMVWIPCCRQELMQCFLFVLHHITFIVGFLKIVYTFYSERFLI